MTTVGLEPCPVCPESVVSCAHLDGRVVWLADNQLWEQRQFHRRPRERWAILGPSALGRCSCEEGHVGMKGRTARDTDSLAEAETEYERRCALLRAEP